MGNPLSYLNTGIQSEMQKRINQMIAGTQQPTPTSALLRETYGTTGGSTTTSPNPTADYLRSLYGNPGGSSSSGSGTISSSASSTSTVAAPVYNYPTYAEYYQSSGYQAAYEAQQQALQEAINQILSNVQYQKQVVEQEADEAARQAYIGYMQSKTVLPQALASKGYNGGLADSYVVGLETNLQNNQNQIALNKANTLAQLEQAFLSAQSQAGQESAARMADIALAATGAWNNYIMSLNNMNNSNYWKQLEYDNAAQNAASALSSSSSSSNGSSKPFQWVADMINSGLLPDDNILQLPTLSKAERKRLEAMVAAR